MVWASFLSSGVGNIHIIDSIMDKYEYGKILDTNLIAFAVKLNLGDIIFQQDNDSKHTCKFIKQWKYQKNINLLEWSAQSPDLNSIENLLKIIKEKLADRNKKYG